MFSGDALAAPTHWYYGGESQIKSDYGRGGITGYTKPKLNLPGSILNKSNTNGGGRGSFHGGFKPSIIGDVINHGKRPYWDPSKSYHYHATLDRGENTLEVQLVRTLMKSVVANGGSFSAEHFRSSYVDFMTTPGSHNDTYASTCHRMFFANLIHKKLPPRECPDNDMHNVDTIDGLILPTVTAIVVAGRGGTKVEVGDVAAATAGVTRRSKVLENMARVWGEVVYDAVRGEEGTDMVEVLNGAAGKIGMGRKVRTSGRDEMSACYLSQSVPSALDMAAKYDDTPNGAWVGLLANANNGGENVHRGAILGAFLGARAGVENLPPAMISELHDSEKLKEEIDAFVEAVMKQ